MPSATTRARGAHSEAGCPRTPSIDQLRANSTFRRRMQRMMRNLQVHNLPGLVRFAIRTGMVMAE
jgi:hypothetical protein